MRRPLLLVLSLAAACRHEAGPDELLAAADRDLASESMPGARSAVARYLQALSLVGADKAKQLQIHTRLGDAYEIADPNKLQDELFQAITLADELGDRDAALRLRVRLIAAADVSKDLQIASLRAILIEAQAASARHAEIAATERIGRYLALTRHLSEAIPVLTHGLELVRVTPDPVLEADLENWLGNVYQALGDRDRALPRYLRALELARTGHRPRAEAQATNNIGNVYMWLYQDRPRALVYFSRALAAYNLLGLGESLSALGTRQSIASSQSMLGDPEAALISLTAGVATYRSLVAAHEVSEADLSQGLLNLAPVLSTLGRNAEARKAYVEAADLARKTARVHQLDQALIGVARVDLAEHKWSDAEAGANAFLAGIAAREGTLENEQLRLSYSAATRAGHEVLLQALVGEEDFIRAFATSERLRSRRLLATLGSGEIIDGAGAQALLDADTTLVEYAFDGLSIHAFVVDQGSVVGIDLGTVVGFNSLVRAWYDLASSAEAAPEKLQATARRLADRILTPIAPRLHGKRLVIVPDKSLAYVAFAALPLPDGKPLVDRFELVEVPSASVLRELRRRGGARPRPSRELAIVADPIFDKNDARLGGTPPAAMLVASRAATDLVRLPSTHVEAAAIAALLPPGQVFLAEGTEATRAAALGPEVAGARYVHFATHALLDATDPDKSALAFTQVDPAGAATDGFVRAPEIAAWHPAAEMVVLSACKTAMGKGFDGEGMVGLTRSFLLAGVPRIVSSLWQVDDVATADLMARFYRGLLAEHLSPPAALRRAQLDALAGNVPTRLWAAFAFTGDWR